MSISAYTQNIITINYIKNKTVMLVYAVNNADMSTLSI